MNKTVAIFGAGVAGLTIAHELAERGYEVNVYEANSEAGGFFRSARRQEDGLMPSEYSWHGMGPWYHNVYDILKRIPFDKKSSLYEKGITRPIDFGVASNDGRAAFDEFDSWTVDVRKMFSFSFKDHLLWAWIILRAWCANSRSENYYSTIYAKAAWQPHLSKKALETWCSTFGPWIGSDWCHVSYHQAAHFYRKQLFSQLKHLHQADEEGAGWIHKARSGWVLLKGPSNEVWFERWVDFLQQRNVKFHWQTKLEVLNFDGTKITSALLDTNQVINADFYFLAINPFFAANILDKTPALGKLSQLNLFRPLIENGPHIQVSFRIGFKEKIKWPRKRCALIIANSEFNLTLFAQEQAWSKDIFLGEQILSLWTVTACVSQVKGRIHGLPLVKCTREQFIEEVFDQLDRCRSLDNLIREANDGRSWKTFTIIRTETWHEWNFSSEGIHSSQPKWVNTTKTQNVQPLQRTTLPNLALAGAHTKTTTDVWSIEAAVESGKLAAQILESDIKIINQYNPPFFEALGRMDDLLFYLKLPNIIDCLFIFVLALLASLIIFILI